MNTQSSIVVQRLCKYCNALRNRRRLSVVGEVPHGDDIESAVEAGLVRAGRLRDIVPFRGRGAAVRV